MLKKLIEQFIVFLNKVYQKVISLWTPTSFRYVYLCSSYSSEALKKHDVKNGFKLTVKRISSCHPRELMDTIRYLN